MASAVAPRRCASRAASVLLLAVACAAPPATAAEYAARTAAELAAALARAAPGDVFVLEDGTWRDQRIEFAAEGTADAPVMLRARTPGGVRLTGTSRLEISGRWLQVEGLRFEGGALGPGQAVVQFRGRRGSAADSRFTESAIVRVNPPDPATRYAWVALQGQRNRVDHNRFEGQAHSGVTVVVDRRADIEDTHRIDANHFVDRAPGLDNGFESIRIGTSAEAGSASRTIVEGNLFERVDGEIEVVSVKSGGNVVRGNTFLDSAGTLTLRHGSDNLVDDNHFIASGRAGTGGIRVMGEGHVVRRNLLQGLSGRAGGAIVLQCGPPARYRGDNPPVRRVELRDNLVADTKGPAFRLDAGCGTLGRSVLAEDVAVVGNLVAARRWSEGEAGEGWAWRDNRFDGPADAPLPRAGVTRTATLLVRGADGVWQPAPGQPPAGPQRPPLAARDVGPSWWH